MAIEELEEELLKLSAPERARLAGRLLESLDEPEPDPSVEDKWIQEGERRYQEMIDGKVSGISAAEALKKARERLR